MIDNVSGSSSTEVVQCPIATHLQQSSYQIPVSNSLVQRPRAKNICDLFWESTDTSQLLFFRSHSEQVL